MYCVDQDQHRRLLVVVVVVIVVVEENNTGLAKAARYGNVKKTKSDLSN